METQVVDQAVPLASVPQHFDGLLFLCLRSTLAVFIVTHV